MGKLKSRFFCQQCGYESVKWLGKCPACGEWNSFVEEKVNAYGKSKEHNNSLSTAIPLNDIQGINTERITTGIKEFDRVLGGGIVPGSLILLGGDPGIGKSTLILQTSKGFAYSNNIVLYVSGEESQEQIKMRAERLQISANNLYILAETSLENINSVIEQLEPKVVIIDSIQTVYDSEINSAPGTVSQVREATGRLLRIAKTKNIAIIIIGHVTKSGEIAGPRILEHMVDCVLYFEGERHHTYRMLRSVKNRFGSTHELGIFEMKGNGLEEIINPSQLLLAERPINVAGSVVVANMEGTRPVLVEVQALVSPTVYPSPRRMSDGVDPQRIALIMAVLEKREGYFLQNQDAYINIAGGIKVNEPAVDLAITVAIVSSYRNKPVSPFTVIIGEIGLTGEVRGVPRIEQRVWEAKKLGFQKIIIPKKNIDGWHHPKDLEIIAVNSINETIEIVLGD